MSNRGKKAWAGILSLFIIFSCSSLVFAQEKIIELKDGVVLQGKVLSKDSEFYKISTRTLGAVLVKDSDIVSIKAAPPQSQTGDKKAQDAGPGKIDLQPDAQLYQENIINNPELLESMKTLSQDEELTELLADPEVKAAIMNHDVEFLRNNEKFQKFMNNELLHKVIEEMTQPKPRNKKIKQKGLYGGENKN